MYTMNVIYLTLLLLRSHNFLCYCLQCNSYDVNLENFQLNQLSISHHSTAYQPPDISLGIVGRNSV